MKTHIAAFALLAVSASLSPGAVLIQELFDTIGTNNTNLSGWGNGTSSVGMTGTWLTNGNLASVRYANNINVDGNTLPGQPSNNGASGGIWQGGGSNWGTTIYSTRPLATTIDFAVAQTIYFSVRLENGGDTAMGIGLASGSDGSAQFVGAGFHWNSMTAVDSSAAGNAAYITFGTLGQNLTGNNDGVYAVRAHEAAASVNGYGLLVGRITISPTGGDIIDIKRYAENAVIDNDLSAITWSATASVNSSMEASRLLLWMNGSGGGGLDAIRFGETWTDVTGVDLIPEPSAAGLGGLGLAVLLRRRRSSAC